MLARLHRHSQVYSLFVIVLNNYWNNSNYFLHDVAGIRHIFHMETIGLKLSWLFHRIRVGSCWCCFASLWATSPAPALPCFVLGNLACGLGLPVLSAATSWSHLATSLWSNSRGLLFPSKNSVCRAATVSKMISICLSCWSSPFLSLHVLRDDYFWFWKL